MAHTVVFMGRFSCGATSVSVVDFINGLREAGRQVSVIDLAQPDADQRLRQSLHPLPDCFVGFDGMGCDLKLGNQSLFQATGTPLVAVMTEHPIYYYDRVHGFNIQIGCCDRTHAAFLKAARPPLSQPLWIPHGATAADIKRQPFAERNEGIVFAGSYPGEPEQLMACLPKVDDAIVRGLAEIMLERHGRTLLESIRLAASPLSPQVLKLLPIVDRYVRAYRRLACLQKLDQAGIAVDIYGSGWPRGLFECHQTFRPLSYMRVLRLMAQYQFVLNIGGNIPDGGHERSLSAALNGAICITDTSPFYQQRFGDTMIGYCWDALGALPELLREVRADSSRLEAMAASSQELASEGHTWHRRAVDLTDSFRRPVTLSA